MYEILTHFIGSPGTSTSAKVSNYFQLWNDLHKNTVNISEDGWNALKEVMIRFGLGVSADKPEIFLFAVESYLDALMKMIALNRMGQTIRDSNNFLTLLQSNRSALASSILEWYFDALSDVAAPVSLKAALAGSLSLMISLIDQLDFTITTFDVFREIYQNIFPREVRRSLGEFYTNEEIITQVLESAKFNPQTIIRLFGAWESGATDTVILDPACGSGTFLVVLIKKISETLTKKGVSPGKILNFVQASVVGIDVNPFAVDMAKLNYMLAIIESLRLPAPSNIPVYWADSLTKTDRKAILGATQLHTFTTKMASLSIISSGVIEVPDSSEFYDSEQLVRDVHSHVEQGRSFADFIAFLSSNPSNRNIIQNLSDFRTVLERLYQAITEIQSAGNSRILNLMTNSVKITNLKGRCAFVVGNPPWVRIHEISNRVSETLKADFRSFQETYAPSFVKTVVPFTVQFDYSMAFVEASLDFLSEEGTLAFVITSKIEHALYAGGLRKILLNLTLLSLIDYSLHPTNLFSDVTNYPLIFSVTKKPRKTDTDITVYNIKGDRTDFKIPQSHLPLYQQDEKSPWVIAPNDVMEVVRRL
jgi:hypothetical protein